MTRINCPITNKDAMLHVADWEKGNIHTSWQLPDGMIIVYELIAENYPSACLFTFDTKEEYFKAISKVDWILEGFKEQRYEDTYEKYKAFLENREDICPVCEKEVTLGHNYVKDSGKTYHLTCYHKKGNK